MKANKVATSTDKSKAGEVVIINAIVDTVTPEERQRYDRRGGLLPCRTSGFPRWQPGAGLASV
jgi:hypothetical protein